MPQANLAGYVWDKDSSQPVAGQVVELVDEQSGIVRASVLSDADGRYKFNLEPVLEGRQVLVRLGLCADWLYLRSRSAINDIQPVATSPRIITFPEQAAGTNDYVRAKQHDEVNLLAQFWQNWSGEAQPGTAFAALDSYLNEHLAAK